MPAPNQRYNLRESKFWMSLCGCPKPALHWSSDFDARVCQNCGVILTQEEYKTHSQSSSFVHLRVHTHLSLMKAICKTKDLIKLSKEYGMPALAKTEYGSLCGAPTFVKDCEEAGIKPILGTDFELRLNDVPYNVTFIALNRNGYKHLVRMNTIAWCERKHKKKDVHVLLDDVPNSNELIALVDVGVNSDMAKMVCQSLCYKIPTYIEVNTEDDRHFNTARHIQSTMPNNDCIVVTGNVHYTYEEDKDAYGVALKIGKHAVDYQLNNDIDNWFKPPALYGSFYSFPQEWVENTNKIASMVEDYGIVNKEPIVPTFKEEIIVPGTNEKQTKEYTNIDEVNRKLEIECWKGLYEKGKHNIPEYQQRIQYELDVMKQKKFSSYHLLIGEIVSWMKKQGIMVPFGRGSSVGSLVCYALDIITMDPLQWGVPFERYINSGRVDLPDIDTDISQERRGEVLNHIADVHGSDRVAHIATFQTLKLRAAIENTGRALQVPKITNRDLKDVIPEDATEWDSLHDDDKAKIKKEMEFKPEWLDIALAMTGTAKHLGYHAAGVVISNDSLNDLVPILPPEENGGLYGIQYDMHDCDVLGLLKLDMLGLRNIDIIQHTIDRIESRRGFKLDVYSLTPDDPNTYKTISDADYVSVFQLDSTGYRRLCRQLKPNSFYHIMALNALFRPGPLEGGMTDEYVERRHGRKELVGWHPWLDDVLSTTYQVPVFQEQVMAIAKHIAGFNDVEADKYRKAIGKKDAEKFQEAQDKFRQGAINREGLTPPPGFEGSLEEWVDDLIKKLAGYARYGWNIGHSVGYGFITYVTAYLETHYPHEYYASLLDAFYNYTKKLPTLLRAILSKNIEIVPPHVNESGILYDVGSDDRIYMGLSAVRNVGKSASEILEERNKNGKFSSFIEFCQRLPGVNKNAKINLVKAGAFRWDTMLCDRDKVDNIDVIHKWVKKRNKSFNGSKVPPFEIAMKLEMVQGNEYNDLEKSNLERESLNTFITGHPADIYQNLSPYLERGSIRVIIPSQLNPDEVDLGETVLLVGMIDYMKRKYTKANDRYPSRPYLSLSVSDTQSFKIINIWYPLCDEIGQTLVAGEVAMFECTTIKDKFDNSKYMVKVATAINLAHGLPIQGVFTSNGSDPTTIVNRIGGIVNQDSIIGDRKFASVRGRISVKPHVLDSAIKEFGGNIRYLISMDALE